MKRREMEMYLRSAGVKSANARFTPEIGISKMGVKSANACFTPDFD